MTADCTTRRGPLGAVDARLNDLVASVSGWSALFVGASTVALSTEFVELLPFPNFYRALALLPFTIAVMYVLLALAVRLERRSR